LKVPVNSTALHILRKYRGAVPWQRCAQVLAQRPEVGLAIGHDRSHAGASVLRLER